MFNKVFATAVNCMDGRVQMPVINYLIENYNIDYVDMITEPGPIKILSENININLINLIKKRVIISVEKHNSNLIAIAGHYDCAGNPEDKDIQIKQIIKSIETVKSWYGNVQIIGLWINENWIIKEINNK